MPMLVRGANGVSVGRCLKGFAAAFVVMMGEVSQPRRMPAGRPENFLDGSATDYAKTAACSLCVLIAQIPL